MNLRVKLLLAFSALALSALTFFGFIAYDSAITTSIKKETALLKIVFERSVQNIAKAIEEKQELQHVLDTIVNNHNGHLSIIVTNQTGEQVARSSMIDQYLKIESHIDQDPNGQYYDKEHAYTWTTVEVPGTSLSTTYVFELNKAPQLSFIRQMGISLAFTAFIVLWFGAWAAMYLASLIEKLHEQRASLQHQAMHDNLTGLPNRVHLHETLENSFNLHNEKQFALCFIDLNRFKEVNDTLGHHNGDLLLSTVSKRLLDTLKGSDTVARLGGDEFAIVLHNTDRAGAEAVAKHIVNNVEEAIELDGESCFVSCSIGIACYPEDGNDADELLRNADAAMYCAKKNGINYLFYEQQHSISNESKLSISSDLKNAINNKEITVYYQAKFDISEKRITGAEALARWDHPERGFIPPPEFIEAAESNGLITPLSYLVIENAFRDQKALEASGYPLSIAVNLSNCNLTNPEFVENVKRIARQYDINPRKFNLELTESAVMSNPEQVKSALTALADLGFIISIDDFGTGYSSLSNLKRLPVDEIKIDRSFIFNLFSNEEDASIVRSTIALGRSLGLNVVAEGVETEEILDLIGVFGCNEAQGFFISKPIPFDQFHSWLNSQNEFVISTPGTNHKYS